MIEGPSAANQLPPAGRRWRFTSGHAGLALLVLLGLAALLAPWIAPRDPNEIRAFARFLEPQADHLLGTDFFGRDILSRILFGLRSSLLVALISVSLAAVLGSATGIVAAYVGGRADMLLMRVMDVVFAFPVMLLGIGIVVILGPGNTSIILAIGIVYIPIFARVARAPALTVKEHLFVEAARAAGQTEPRIVTRHLLPNILGPILVQVTNNLATAILFEASLSFLGLGIQPPWPSLGRMVSDGLGYIEISPWATVFPGLAIMTLVLAFNLLSDYLQERWDPRR